MVAEWETKLIFLGRWCFKEFFLNNQQNEVELRVLNFDKSSHKFSNWLLILGFSWKRRAEIRDSVDEPFDPFQIALNIWKIEWVILEWNCNDSLLIRFKIITRSPHSNLVNLSFLTQWIAHFNFLIKCHEFESQN